MAFKWGWSDHHLRYLGWSSKSRQIWTRTPMPSSYHRFGAPSANEKISGEDVLIDENPEKKRWAKLCPLFEQKAKKNMSIVFFGEMSFYCRCEWFIYLGHPLMDFLIFHVQQSNESTCPSRKSLAQNTHQGWRSDPQLSAKWNETIKPSIPSPAFVLFRCYVLGQFLGGPKSFSKQLGKMIIVEFHLHEIHFCYARQKSTTCWFIPKKNARSGTCFEWYQVTYFPTFMCSLVLTCRETLCNWYW